MHSPAPTRLGCCCYCYFSFYFIFFLNKITCFTCVRGELFSSSRFLFLLLLLQRSCFILPGWSSSLCCCCRRRHHRQSQSVVFLCTAFCCIFIVFHTNIYEIELSISAGAQIGFAAYYERKMCSAFVCVDAFFISVFRSSLCG